MTDRLAITFVLAATCFGITPAVACEIRVRDSAFRSARDLHRLYVIADPIDETAQVTFDRVNQWLDEIEGDFNVTVERIDANDAEFDWRSIGIPSAPPVLPVTVLVGRDNGTATSFVIDHFEPAPSDEQLASLLNSPLRQKLADQLARHIAVLIYAPQDSTSVDEIDDRVISSVESRIENERIGLSVIRLDRSDPDEQLLCRFMGIRPDSPDTLCVAFGRGKLMSPPLIGDEITTDNIHTLVTQIRQACSCSKPLSTIGVDLPLVWSAANDAGIILMDEELDLSELDGEVQNMLDAKANAAALSETTEVSIPPGYTPRRIDSESSWTRRSLWALVGLGMLAVIVALIVVNHLRLARMDSTN